MADIRHDMDLADRQSGLTEAGEFLVQRLRRCWQDLSPGQCRRYHW